jgi:hypothetical protein
MVKGKRRFPLTQRSKPKTGTSKPKTGTDGVTPKADASNCKPQANRISGGLGWVTRGLERVKKSTQASQPLLLLIEVSVRNSPLEEARIVCVKCPPIFSGHLLTCCVCFRQLLKDRSEVRGLDSKAAVAGFD